MNEEIESRQEYARRLVDVGVSSLTHAYLEEYGAQAVESAKEVAESEVRADVKPSSKGESVVYEFLENIGLLDKRSEKYYRVEGTQNELQFFGSQLEEHLEDGYGKYELIAYLQVHSEKLSNVMDEERSATVDYMNALNGETPSETPYRNKFGSFTWALHVAGLENREELDQEIIEDKLRKAVHEKNKERDVLLETLSASEIRESDTLPTKLRDKPFFDSTEDAYQKAGFGTIRSLEKEAKKWRNITAHYPEIEEIEERDLRAVF